MPLRVATKDDIPDLFDMLVELAIFEKLDHEVHISREQFGRDFEDGCFRGFIVIDDETERPAGMVLYHYTYDCWKGKTMSMDELIVRPEYRQKRYGKLLWAAVAQVAKEREVSHIMWDVLDWNKGAINFYHSVEGVFDTTKDNEGFLRYKMSKEGIERFAATI
ncbi:hypothetical protein PRIPAC_73461 [Pristionchus pacificus]|nr:hypothetical protein PRIPAC_73461 [Pristionchus pacificus]